MGSYYEHSLTGIEKEKLPNASLAAAMVARVDMIVSWNFKHIVHYDKIRGYHGVNLLNGYMAIPIYSPPEVI